MQETPKTTNPYIGKTVVELTELRLSQGWRMTRSTLIQLNEAENIAIKAGNWGLKKHHTKRGSNWIDKTHEF